MTLRTLVQEGDRRAFWLVALACVLLLVGLAYGNALGAGLLFDSSRIIREDPRLQAFEGSHLEDILLDDYWFGLDSNLYRPLTTLSYAFNYSVLGNGSDATGYIAVNVLIHALNGLLVVALVRALTSSGTVALLAGALFSVHPLGTEAVTNVVGRADLLAAAGVLAGALLHVRIVRAGRFRLALSAGLAAASALAIASKESGIVLVGVVVLHDLVFELPRALAGETGAPRGRRLRAYLRERLVRSYLWCLLPVPAYLILRAVAFSGGASPPSLADNPLLMLAPLSASVNAAGVVLRYLGLVLWPARLSADYSYDAIPLFQGTLESPSDWVALMAGPFLIALVVAALVLRRRAPAASFFLLFFFVAIAPVSNVFVRIGTIMAERLAYLPSVGPIALLSWWSVATLAAPGRRRPKPSAALAGGLVLCVLAGLSYRTARRNLDWYSGVALFSSAVRASPGSFKAHKSLAAELYLAAADEEQRRLHVDTILEHAETAWKILQRLPREVGYSDLLADLATYYRLKARIVPEREARPWLERARETYTEAIAAEEPRGPRRNWRLHLGLAEVLRDLGRRDEALERFQTALELAPGPEVLAPLATLLSEAGREREALLCALRLITLQAEHQAMWQIVSEHYARAYPGEATVSHASGQWLFETRHPAVAADLREAVRQQYEAALRLGPKRGGDSYRSLVQGLLGIDPASTP